MATSEYSDNPPPDNGQSVDNYLRKAYLEIEEPLFDIKRLAQALSLMSCGLEKGLEEQGSVFMLSGLILDRCEQVKTSLYTPQAAPM